MEGEGFLRYKKNYFLDSKTVKIPYKKGEKAETLNVSTSMVNITITIDNYELYWRGHKAF